jgi:hypothetical protein
MMEKNLLMPLHPSISAASKTSTLMPIMAAISIIVVFPNHIRKFMNPINDRVPNVDPIKSIFSWITPKDIKIELIGPFVENMVKNSMANADAIIRFGR